ncbi:unnamed protein product [Pieris brassicae]|uniref:Uncharacterized protein n=1 Tax=Pieris brassicae TaxID=7116 RepID=A0A9P0TUG3_PIEBR|nr:unnamed protein product [Pieris brassicae]
MKYKAYTLTYLMVFPRTNGGAADGVSDSQIRQSSSTLPKRLAPAHSHTAARSTFPNRFLEGNPVTHGGMSSQTRRRRRRGVYVNLPRPPSSTATIARLIQLLFRSMRWRRRFAHDYSGRVDALASSVCSNVRTETRTIDTRRRALRLARSQPNTTTIFLYTLDDVKERRHSVDTGT